MSIPMILEVAPDLAWYFECFEVHIGKAIQKIKEDPDSYFT